MKPVTGSLKTTVKLIGETPAGSAWPAAWLMVTVGGASTVTVAVLLAGLGSCWGAETANVTVRGVVASDRATIDRFRVAPAATLSKSHVPRPAFHEHALAPVLLRYWSPAGSVTLSRSTIAVLGPRFDADTLKVTLLPTGADSVGVEAVTRRSVGFLAWRVSAAVAVDAPRAGLPAKEARTPSGWTPMGTASRPTPPRTAIPLDPVVAEPTSWPLRLKAMEWPAAGAPADVSVAVSVTSSPSTADTGLTTSAEVGTGVHRLSCGGDSRPPTDTEATTWPRLLTAIPPTEPLPRLIQVPPMATRASSVPATTTSASLMSQGR